MVYKSVRLVLIDRAIGWLENKRQRVLRDIQRKHLEQESAGFTIEEIGSDSYAIKNVRFSQIVALKHCVTNALEFGGDTAFTATFSRLLESIVNKND